MRHQKNQGGIDVLGWVQAAEPPNMDIPRKQNPRRQSETSCSVRSAYCGTRTVRLPNIRLANSCGTLANCIDDQVSMIKTHVDQFKLRESSKKKDKRTKKERQEQRIIDLLTVKAALSVLRESCWYWGNISGDRAREVLRRSAPGTFLIRDSSDKRYLFSLSVMTVRGPTSIRLIFSRGCFRIETSGIISPRSPCAVSLIVRMAYLSRNSIHHPPISEQNEISIQSQRDCDAGDTDDTDASNRVQYDDEFTPPHAVESKNSVRTFVFESQTHNRTQSRTQTPKKVALLERPLLSKVPSLKHLGRVAVNKFNLRNFANESLSEYINQYPYPI